MENPLKASHLGADFGELYENANVLFGGKVGSEVSVSILPAGRRSVSICQKLLHITQSNTSGTRQSHLLGGVVEPMQGCGSNGIEWNRIHFGWGGEG